ncbi:MAG: hypothetical protein H2056_08790 [Sphingopyxis sp.]|nr:hypothetical protein [Sphingopyxis sp.]
MIEVRKTPVHLWIVGVVATLWNSFGVTDYFMTRTRGTAWIDQMMPGVDSAKFMAYIDAFPIWASTGWACGVWGALAGSLLLLARSRHAVTAFAVSLVGAIVGIGYQLMNPVDIPEMAQGANAVMPYVIIAIAAVLLWYAQRQKAAGVLR